MKTEQLSYQELELIEISPSKFQQFKIKYFSWLSKFWNFIVECCIREPELKIVEQKDGAGNICYYIHDPLTDRSFYCASEQEVLIWLEQRYYQGNINGF
ncbi:hypothetical protein ACE1CI_14195 [Aerosakkonemataceae cyanobacterium BLCC-F50]|uniref:Uncharacterized protein n=1 Tax=Floridaenema flaviceps BLCC-F50 TaxID=3153642 RepID=A0ABV4XRL1_9CYAN